MQHKQEQQSFSDFSDYLTSEELAEINKYKVKLNGFMLEVYNQDEEILLTSDLVDNSVFIIKDSSEAITAANILGSKRFIIPDHTEVGGSVNFPRDRYFLTTPVPVDLNSHISFVVGIDDIKKSIPEDQLYKKLAELFAKANFTDTKQAEYEKKKISDKYCRFNSPSILPIFMLHDKDLIGCIRLAQIPIDERLVVYLSDEIGVHEGFDQKTLKGYLFNAVREELQKMPLLYAFIRVAARSEKIYEELGCDQQNSGISVIHGKPTPLMEKLQKVVKQKAQEARAKFEPPKSSFLSGHTSGQSETTKEEQVEEIKLTN
jgi:hypothetical protein